MKDFNDYLPKTIEIVDLDIERLKEYGDKDAVENYLLFLRDEINNRLKATRKAKK